LRKNETRQEKCAWGIEGGIGKMVCMCALTDRSISTCCGKGEEEEEEEEILNANYVLAAFT
jgi:hypothetical protein